MIRHIRSTQHAPQATGHAGLTSILLHKFLRRLFLRMAQLQDFFAIPFTRKARSFSHTVGAPVGASVVSVGAIVVGANVVGLEVNFVGSLVVGAGVVGAEVVGVDVGGDVGAGVVGAAVGAAVGDTVGIGVVGVT